jgi:DNA-binding XRE family transcriptional regulator
MSINNLSFLGSLIADKRKNKSMNQKDFAYKAGISRTKLYMIEKGLGNPSFNDILKICQMLNINLEAI